MCLFLYSAFLTLKLYRFMRARQHNKKYNTNPTEGLCSGGRGEVYYIRWDSF